MDKLVDSFKDIDFSNYDTPVITIYYSPRDYLKRFVARLYDWDRPTDIVMVRNTIEDIYNGIPEDMGRVTSHRYDLTQIVESWAWLHLRI